MIEGKSFREFIEEIPSHCEHDIDMRCLIRSELQNLIKDIRSMKDHDYSCTYEGKLIDSDYVIERLGGELDP